MLQYMLVELELDSYLKTCGYTVGGNLRWTTLSIYLFIWMIIANTIVFKVLLINNESHMCVIICKWLLLTGMLTSY